MAQYVYTMHRVGKIVPPKRHILKDISLSFFPGAKIGVLGLNGSGKSTLLKIMAGVDTEIEGEAQPMAGLKIGYLPQESSVFRRLSVEHNVLAILEMLGYAREERIRRVDELLKELDLIHIRESMAYALSGGERRRLEITRALATAPSFMLLDEPAGGLTHQEIDHLADVVRTLRIDYHGGLGYPHLVRDESRPDLLAAILAPRAGEAPRGVIQPIQQPIRRILKNRRHLIHACHRASTAARCRAMPTHRTMV